MEHMNHETPAAEQADAQKSQGEKTPTETEKSLLLAQAEAIQRLKERLKGR